MAKKISDLTTLDNCNDNTNLVVNKYLNNGNYQIQLIQCSNFAEKINSNINAEQNITETEIEEQTEIITQISSMLNTLSNNIDENINNISNISSDLSDTLLSDITTAECLCGDFKNIEDTVVSNILSIENSISFIEKSQDIFDSFNEVFKVINFENINNILALSGEIHNNISALSTNYNNCSVDIQTKLNDTSEDKLNIYYNILNSQKDIIDLSVKAIFDVLKCDVVNILSNNITSIDTSCTLTCNIESNLSIDKNRIIANIYEKKSDIDIYSIINNVTDIDISENTITVNFDKTNKENCILVVTFFKKPTITNVN